MAAGGYHILMVEWHLEAWFPKFTVPSVSSQNIRMLTDPRYLGVLSFKATWSTSPRYSGFWGMLLLARDWVPSVGPWPFGERLCLAHCWKKCKELSELCCLPWGPAELPL